MNSLNLVGNTSLVWTLRTDLAYQRITQCLNTNFPIYRIQRLHRISRREISFSGSNDLLLKHYGNLRSPVFFLSGEKTTTLERGCGPGMVLVTYTLLLIRLVSCMYLVLCNGCICLFWGFFFFFGSLILFSFLKPGSR